MDGNIYDQFGEVIDRRLGRARVEAQRRAAAGPPPPAMFRLWQEKEKPPFGVEEVGSDEEVTQGLRGGRETEEAIIIESDDEDEEERTEPLSVLFKKMEDLLDKMGRRFILRVDPTTLAYSPRNYVPSDPRIARWLTYIWMFNFELERIPGSKSRADGLSRINWDKQEGEAVENTPPVDGFLDQEEDVRLHINKWSLRVPSCVGYPIWQAPSGYERRTELVLKPFKEEDPWGGKDVQWMMELALASSHSLVEDMRTIEEGPGQVERHEDLMGGMYLLINTLLQESLDQSGSLNPAGNVDEIPESQDNEFEEGEIKEAFRAEEYDGIYLELGLLLSCEMRLRDASDRAQRMLQRYLVRDGHLFVRREVRNPRRVVCGRNRQIDVVAALYDGIAGGHRGVQATYAKISELYYWDGMMDMVGKFCRSCVPCQERSRLRQGEPLHLRLEREAKEGLQKEETPLPSSEKASSPEGRAERRRERAVVRREALILIDRHLAAHALEHPDLEEPAPAEPRHESCQPEKEMEAEIPKRVDLHTRERVSAGETVEEKRARRTRRIDEIWQERQRLEAAGELPEQQQERQRSEAAGALPGQPPSAPARVPEIPEIWRDFWEQRGEELPSPVRAGFGVARKAEERLDCKIKSLAKTTFDRHLLLEGDLAGKKMKEASHGVRLEAMEMKIRELRALVASQAAIIESLRQQTQGKVDRPESSRQGEQRQPGQGLPGQPSATKPRQEPPMGRVILESEEARAQRQAEREAFEFRAPTELPTLPVAAAGPVVPLAVEEGLPPSISETA
ncbi:hypothetical protein CBR_g28669 [Chara braunii]|uniref:Integrase zinc-binding domain-containing protein n=1 Tax=Chara braunii TaxID=69332 RepID=A0A388L9J4_CHABU|nr:hypothetical protein CBR_g28669 [Chara braunii]|eukprot:GBG78954.1 hypothetical protein CBR_g28669 [Chara braunii]